jgi:hypothetical protein
LEDALHRAEALPGGLPVTLAWLRPELAEAYDRADRPERSESIRRDAVNVARQRFGPDDPGTASAAAVLGMNLLSQTRWSEAEPVLRDCLRIRAAKAPGDWATCDTRSMLGGALLGQGRYDEAEPLLVAGYEGLKAREPAIPAVVRSVRLAEAAWRIVRLYEAWGKAEQAAAWKTRLGLADLPADVFARP